MIRFGIVGYGRWGPNLARCVFAEPGCQIASICDVSSERLNGVGNAYPDVRRESDWRRLLADPQIDAIIVATPAALHFDLACAALNAGKHVLVEKPIARTSQHVLALMDLAKRRKLVLMVDHTYLYSPAVRAMRKLVEAEKLGTIIRFDSVRTNVGTQRRDIDVLWDLAVHDVSIVDFLFSLSPQSVSATGSCSNSGEPHSQVTMCIYFSDPFVARIRVGWSGLVKTRLIEISGGKGTLLFDDLEPAEKIRVQSGANINGGREIASIVAVDDSEPLRAMVQDFASCIRHTKIPLSDGSVGLRVVRLLEAAQQSIAKGGSLVQVTADHYSLDPISS
jgi:predicted dehydrogenase